MNQTLLLSVAELIDLTGYSVRPKQEEELRRLKVPYIVNARGRVCVARAAAERRLGVDSPNSGAEEPDFEAMG